MSTSSQLEIFNRNKLASINFHTHKIDVKTVKPADFFPSGAEPSLDHLDPAIFNFPPGAKNLSLSDTIANYLAFVDFTKDWATRDGVLNDFVIETLKLLHFNEHNEVMITNLTLPFKSSKQPKPNRPTKSDISILHHPTALILLVLIKDKSLRDDRIVAEAIAAFRFNNKRRQEWGLPCRHTMTIPGIVMWGTRPTFYLIPVTEALSNAVTRGWKARARTQVLRCITVTEHTHHGSESTMEDMPCRKITLQCFLAFKMLVRDYWDEMLEGYSR